MLGDFALQIKADDNVAMVFREVVQREEVVPVRNPSGTEMRLIAQDDIPFGHKIAVVNIPSGTAVIKYGEIIGRATLAIRVGEHVHIHNMDSCRGRGDLAAKREEA